MVHVENCTGLILAGGKSTRMGCNKALLRLGGRTLLMRQVEKFRNLGVREILISGPEELSVPGTVVIPDIFPDCGPIGGLYSGLISASGNQCLVVSVDVPLLPEEIFQSLCGIHETGITILRHSGGEEPLIGVYDRTAAIQMEQMIRRGEYAVRGLEKTVPVQRWDYFGNKDCLRNCNYPEDYERVKCLLAETAAD